jgi:hypothetical protein
MSAVALGRATAVLGAEHFKIECTRIFALKYDHELARVKNPSPELKVKSFLRTLGLQRCQLTAALPILAKTRTRHIYRLSYEFSHTARGTLFVLDLPPNL